MQGKECKVFQYDEDYNLIDIHRNSVEAAKAVGGHNQCILDACRRENKIKDISTSYGYVWSLEPLHLLIEDEFATFNDDFCN